jgi:ribosomal protein S12 methylthiotransferase accessory factor YcaO
MRTAFAFDSGDVPHREMLGGETALARIQGVRTVYTGTEVAFAFRDRSSRRAIKRAIAF